MPIRKGYVFFAFELCVMRWACRTGRKRCPCMGRELRATKSEYFDTAMARRGSPAGAAG